VRVSAQHGFVGRSALLPAIILIAALVLASGVCAQSPRLTERLAPNTVLYVEWRGMASLNGADKRNHLLQLLADPDFATVWAGLALNFQQGARGKNGVVPQGDLPNLLSLLDNPAVVGLIEIPKQTQVRASDDHASPVGFFLAYDSTGKMDLINKWKSDAHPAPGTPAPEITHYDFGGIQVETRKTEKDVSYTAQAGKYYVASDQKQVIEDLITRFRASDSPATSIEQLPEYQAARQFIGTSSALEFFGRMPDVSRWMPTAAKNKSTVELVKNLHLERIHVLEGGMDLSGEAVRVRGAILGDTSPGGPFDLAAPSVSVFQTQRIASAGPAFTMSRLNLAAAYQFIRTALMASLPAPQTNNLATAESAAQGFLGMSVADALELFSGEIGYASSYSAEGKEERLFAATIQKPDAVLRVLRAVLGAMIANEDSVAGNTFLDISYPYRDAVTGTQRRRFYYVAVTPQMLLAAPRKAMLRQAFAQSTSAPDASPASGLFANAEFLHLRAQMPEKLSGLSAADLTLIPWDKLVANLRDEADRAAKQSKSPPPDLSWLKAFNSGVISRHLHTSVSAWWKESGGVYFDSYLQ